MKHLMLEESDTGALASGSKQMQHSASSSARHGVGGMANLLRGRYQMQHLHGPLFWIDFENLLESFCGISANFADANFEDCEASWEASDAITSARDNRAARRSCEPLSAHFSDVMELSRKRVNCSQKPVRCQRKRSVNRTDCYSLEQRYAW